MRVRVKSRGVAALKELMEVFNLKQSDLYHILGKSGASEILNGKRKLPFTYKQVDDLRKYFSVAADVFFEDE